MLKWLVMLKNYYQTCLKLFKIKFDDMKSHLKVYKLNAKLILKDERGVWK